MYYHLDVSIPASIIIIRVTKIISRVTKSCSKFETTMPSIHSRLNVRRPVGVHFQRTSQIQCNDNLSPCEVVVGGGDVIGGNFAR